jgi:hypothetical protein
MPATVVTVEEVVVPGGWSAGCRVCSGGLPVGGASGGPVGVEIGGVLSSGEWRLSGTRGGGSGSGGVGSRCRLRTVRSIGDPGPCQPREGPPIRSVDPADGGGWSGLREQGVFPAGSWAVGSNLSVGERVGSGHPWGSVSFSSRPGGSAQ